MCPPARGGPCCLAEGQCFRVMDVAGGQVGDLFAFTAADPGEFASASHTRVAIGKLFPRQGDPVLTNRRRPILSVLEDTSPGWHDMLYAACDPARYASLGAPASHRSCAGNLAEALAGRGLEARHGPAADQRLHGRPGQARRHARLPPGLLPPRRLPRVPRRPGVRRRPVQLPDGHRADQLRRHHPPRAADIRVARCALTLTPRRRFWPWPMARRCARYGLNELGGITFEIGAGDRRRFVKWAPAGSGLDLAAEAARLAWAVAFTPVPRPLGQGADRTGSWLVTSALPGEMAITARWKAEPHTAVAAIGAGLRACTRRCPWTAARSPGAPPTARRCPPAGRAGPAGPGPVASQPSGAQRRRGAGLLADAPPVDELVVCHGDSCAPNTLLTADGRCSGHVDLGELGVADRWADLAVATWSTTWNYGPGWETPLLDAYGIAPDPDRTSYYRLLWDLGP